MWEERIWLMGGRVGGEGMMVKWPVGWWIGKKQLCWIDAASNSILGFIILDLVLFSGAWTIARR